MRILLLAIFLFITIHFIRLDLAEGTIPLAGFTKKQKLCDKTEETASIPITTVDGDTIETLFALYPDSESNFIERLSSFYSLNPHLQNQQLIGGEKIMLPLTRIQSENCTESDR
ncbi:hypothetical protein [Sporosarcina limicola]|uniref:LysM domain-containing protein n=1 Tax=Sporosarcina limicola TaxID=34101 RepID=A0A927R2B7_9BACL|nr:hypothetical protein [Sporosarcina limicola]MBE1553741.1 hypothetical protein [Sporosarcina limicola]